MEALLDDWATLLKRRFDALHQQGHYRVPQENGGFHALAAKSRPLRWQAYLRFALAQEPERIGGPSTPSCATIFPTCLGRPTSIRSSAWVTC